jgi:hypothetical protein
VIKLQMIAWSSDKCVVVVVVAVVFVVVVALGWKH